MAVYFFRHGFRPTTGEWGPLPGRCMFSVSAPSLRRTAQELLPEGASSHRICVDGFADDGPGSNVDPNVLSVELPWFLSFCRADEVVHDLRLMPDDPMVAQTLAGAVRKGDVVVFGEPRWARGIAVDTVLCVGARLPLPVTDGGRAFALEADFPRYWKVAQEAGAALRDLTWDEFVRSPDFILNLADSLSEARASDILGHKRQTWHARSAVPEPIQVVGTRCTVDGPVDVDSLVESFLRGQGFDFVPTGTPPYWSRVALAKQRPGVFVATFENAKKRFWPRGRRSSIFRLDDTDGHALLTSILSEAERLVHGPIRWTSPRRFAQFDSANVPIYVPLPVGREV